MLRIDQAPAHRPLNGVLVAAGGTAHALVITRPTWLPRWHGEDETDTEAAETSEEVKWLGWDAWVTLSRGY